MKIQHALKLVPAALVSVSLLGCADSGGDYQEVTPEAAKAAAVSHEHDHHHAHGPNGGDLVELGDHSIHAEVVFDEEHGKLDVYLLGEDAETAHPVALTELTLSFAHGDETEDFTLTAAPLDGEAEGQSSRFSVTDEEIAEEFHEHTDGAHLHFEIDGKEYEGEVHHHHGHEHGDHGDGHDHGDGDHDHGEAHDDGDADHDKKDDDHKDDAAPSDEKADDVPAAEKKPETEVVEE